MENKKVNISYNIENSLHTCEDGSNRARSYSMATSYADYLEKKNQSKRKVSQIIEKNKAQKLNSFLNLLDENDIKISKPITIDNLINERKKCIFLTFFLYLIFS